MVWVAGGTFLMGSDGLLPGGAARSATDVDGFWIDAAPGDRRRVPPLRAANRLRHRGRAAARPRRLSRTPIRSCSCRARSSSARRRGPVDLDDVRNWWAYVPGRVLAAPEGPGQRRRRARAAPGRPRRLRGRRGLRRLGRQGAAHRGRVGVRGARRPRRRGVRLGRRALPERPADGEHLAGRVPLAEPDGRRLRGHLAGRSVPAERLRALRHDRQRLGVDERLRSRSRRSEARAACCAPPRAARTSASRAR